MISKNKSDFVIIDFLISEVTFFDITKSFFLISKKRNDFVISKIRFCDIKKTSSVAKFLLKVSKSDGVNG